MATTDFLSNSIPLRLRILISRISVLPKEQIEKSVKTEQTIGLARVFTSNFLRCSQENRSSLVIPSGPHVYHHPVVLTGLFHPGTIEGGMDILAWDEQDK